MKNTKSLKIKLIQSKKIIEKINNELRFKNMCINSRIKMHVSILDCISALDNIEKDIFNLKTQIEDETK